MRSLTLSIASRDDLNARAKAAFEGRASGSHISFASVELLWKTLTPMRWSILEALTGREGETAATIARRVGLVEDAVKGELAALERAGILDLDEEGVVLFPFDAVHVDFVLKAA